MSTTDVKEPKQNRPTLMAQALMQRSKGPREAAKK